MVAFLSNLLFAFAIEGNSIQHKNKQNSTEVTRIDELNYLANYALKEDYNKALETANTAYIKAKEIQYQKGKIESEIIKSLVFINSNKSKEAFDILNKVTVEIKNLNNKTLKAKTAAAIGMYYYSIGLYDTALVYFNNNISILKSSNNFNDLAIGYINIGRTYIKKGDLHQAQIYHENASQITAKKNLKQSAKLNDLLGEIYHAQKLFDMALISYYTGLKTNFDKANRQLNSSIYLHLGNTYYMLVKDDSAQYYYYLALKNYQQLSDSNGIAICYSNLSRVYLELGKLQTSIDFALKAINTIHDGNYKPIEQGTLQQLGDIYGELGDYKKAEKYLLQALNMAVKHNQKMAENDCLKSLSEIFEMQGKHAQSYQYLIKAYHLKDSLQPLSFNNQLAEMQTKYETEKKEKEIAKLNQIKINNQLKLTEQFLEVKKRNDIIAGVIIFLILITISGVIFYRLQKALQQKINEDNLIKQQLEERQRIAKDLHDEIGSGLSKIALLSALTNRNEINQKYATKTINDTSQKLIENMRDLIWTLKSENSSLENLVIHLREYAAQYLDEFPIKLTLNFQENIASSIFITKEIQHNILMCYKESINNIVKHAKSDTVTINLSFIESILEISIVDNGIGITKNTDSNIAHHGLLNMTNRMKSIGGNFLIESSSTNGTKIVLKVLLKF